MTTSLMLDLETWSTAKNATIVSIGAVKFNPYGEPGTVLEAFHVGVDPALAQPNVRKLFDIDPGTVNWWMAEDRAEARAQWLKLEKVDIGTALAGFAEWFGPEPMPVWGNAASFDCAILESAFKALNMNPPWGYRDERCYRTVKTIFHDVARPPDVIQHDALQDALWQTKHLQRILREVDYRPK